MFIVLFSTDIGELVPTLNPADKIAQFFTLPEAKAFAERHPLFPTHELFILNTEDHYD